MIRWLVQTIWIQVMTEDYLFEYNKKYHVQSSPLSAAHTASDQHQGEVQSEGAGEESLLDQAAVS